MDTRFLTIALLLAGSAQAWAQAQCPPNDVFEWTVAGESGGYSLGWKGGEIVAATVEEGSKRRLGPTHTTGVTVLLGKAVEPIVQKWLRDALEGEHAARDVDLLEVQGSPRTVVRSTRYQGSRITGIAFPAMSVNDRCSLDDL